MVQATAEQSRKNSNFIVDCFMHIITLSIMKLKFNTYIHFIACIIRNIYQLTHLIIFTTNMDRGVTTSLQYLF